MGTYFKAKLTRPLAFRCAGARSETFEIGEAVLVRYNDREGRYDATKSMDGLRYDRLDIPRSAFERE